MPKTILITGSTDGIGLATARMLAPLGHDLLLHGRSPEKLERTKETLGALAGTGSVETYVADLSRLADVGALAQAVADRHGKLDVLINNAGVFKIAEPRTQDGLDVRFAVNTLAPYLLTQRLMPLFGDAGRVVNLSSAAQSSVDLEALAGQGRLSDMEAYAQSKLALTMWTRDIALARGERGPLIVAVNPGSLLATKMVKEGFGVAGGTVEKGADILARATLAEEFSAASGQYFDNDSGRFADPHPDALDPRKSREVVRVVEEILAAGTSTGQNQDSI